MSLTPCNPNDRVLVQFLTNLLDQFLTSLCVLWTHMDHNKPNYEHPWPPLVSEMVFWDIPAPVLGKAKHGISPFPGEFFRVAFGSNPRRHGTDMGLIRFPDPEGQKSPGAGLGCRWCVLLYETLGSGSSIRAKSVDFQISATGAAPRPKQRPFRCLGGPVSFSQHPVAPRRAVRSSLVPVLRIWPTPHTGVRPVRCW